MNDFQTAAVGLCAAGLGCGVLHTLVPEGAMKRVFSVLSGLFFFVCLLSPLTQLFHALGGYAVQAQSAVEVPQDLSDVTEKQMLALLETELLRDANERVASQGLTVTAVRIFRDTSQEDSIYIERIRVVFSKEDHPVPAAVDTLLEQAWGTVVEVYYGE